MMSGTLGSVGQGRLSNVLSNTLSHGFILSGNSEIIKTVSRSNGEQVQFTLTRNDKEYGPVGLIKSSGSYSPEWNENRFGLVALDFDLLVADLFKHIRGMKVIQNYDSNGQKSDCVLDTQDTALQLTFELVTGGVRVESEVTWPTLNHSRPEPGGLLWARCVCEKGKVSELKGKKRPDGNKAGASRPLGRSVIFL
jgi:hypothetical protein